MTNESDDEMEIEMIMERKSRFSRYRRRIREGHNVDINETIVIEDHDINEMQVPSFFLTILCTTSIIRTNEVSHFQQQNAEPVAEVQTTKRNQYTQTIGSFDIEIPDSSNENINHIDLNQVNGKYTIFLFHNHYVSIF